MILGAPTLDTLGLDLSILKPLARAHPRVNGDRNGNTSGRNLIGLWRAQHGPTGLEVEPTIITDNAPNVHHQALEVTEVMDAEQGRPQHLPRHEQVAEVSPRETAGAGQAVASRIHRGLIEGVAGVADAKWQATFSISKVQRNRRA